MEAEVIRLKADVADMKNDIKELKEKVDKIFDFLYKFTKRISDDEMEWTSLGHKVQRHDDWIKLLAKKTKLPDPN